MLRELDHCSFINYNVWVETKEIFKYLHFQSNTWVCFPKLDQFEMSCSAEIVNHVWFSATYFHNYNKTACVCFSFQLSWGWNCRKPIVAPCGCCRRVESDDAEVCYAGLKPHHWQGVYTFMLSHTPVLTCPTVKKYTDSWTELCCFRLGPSQVWLLKKSPGNILDSKNVLKRGRDFRSRKKIEDLCQR